MEEVLAQIKELLIRPKYVFLTSKSGVGKTYFSNRLEGYQVLELDQVVKSIAKAFDMEEPAAFKVYKNTLSEAVTKAVVQKIHEFFELHRGKEIVLEGAVADAELVKRIFSGRYKTFTFVYLYPVDVDAYVARMKKRFQQDKENGTRTLAVWPQVTPEIEAAADDSVELKEFMEKMARWSIGKAAERYEHFKQNGIDMIRVDV